MRSVLAVVSAIVVLLGGAPAQVSGTTNNTIAGFRVIASPFTSDNVSTRHAAGIRLRLARRARVTLTIETAGGAVVRRLASGSLLAKGGHRWSWAGRDDSATFVPDGDYMAHVMVKNALGIVDASLPVRKGMPRVYPANPGAITVLINPGHGGTRKGAVSPTLLEKDANLDIGLRLRRLLRAAGVNVVMTRATDTSLNLPPIDLNGDGIVGRPPGEEDWDELEARVDLGNQARADVHIFNHNNGAGCRCLHYTETFTGMHRTWTPEGIALATFVQSAQMAQLDTFTSAAWSPIDHGVRDGARYFTLSPYTLSTPRRIPRPTLMPALLTESLFVSDPIENELLRRPQVRESIAIAIYLGIGEYLAMRAYGMRYELLDGPSEVSAGGPADYQLRVTNTGNLPSAGWQLQLHNVVAVPLYDGSDAIGDPMGSVDIPNGLAPGASTTLTVHANAPPTAGQWLAKADTFIGGAERPLLSQRGVVALQVPLTTDL
jgi:N-acetylmuramoyl-L-alanine amidase